MKRWSISSRRIAIATVAFLYVGAWLLLWPLDDLRQGLDARPVAHGIFGLLLVIIGGAFLRYLRNTRRLDRNDWAAVGWAIALPVVVLLVLTGLCLPSVVPLRWLS